VTKPPPINASLRAARLPQLCEQHSTHCSILVFTASTCPKTHPKCPVSSQSQALIMSDIEDEMDVDAPVDNSISFGGDSKKGKRSAANLPVEAEDTLPW
jgi:hypothetical protein